MAQIGDLTLIRLDDGNTGTHSVIGPSTRTNYGYHAHGEQFYVRQADADSLVLAKQAVLVEEKKVDAPKANVPTPKHQDAVRPTAVPVMVKPAPPPGKPDDLTRVWGLGAERIDKLNAAGITTFAQLADMSADKLFDICGLSSQSANRVVNAARNLSGDA